MKYRVICLPVARFNIVRTPFGKGLKVRYTFFIWKSPTLQDYKQLWIFSHVCWTLSPEKSWLNSLCNISWCILVLYFILHSFHSIRHCIPGHAVSGGCGILALHAVASSPSPDPGGARGGPILANWIHTGLPGHVEPHGLLVVDMDALSGWHVTLVGEELINDYSP